MRCRRSLVGGALAALLGLLGAAADAEPTMPAPLTSMPGSATRGRTIVRDINRATCLICHAMPIPEEPDHGTIGPSLAGIGRRATPAELRQRLIDPTVLNPATVMPAYRRSEGLHRVLGRHRGQSLYSAQEIEDVVAYLMTLTGE